MMMLNLDRFSLSAVPIVCLSVQGDELGNGTGCFHEYNSDIYLVSNWHVLAGRDPKSGQPNHDKGAVPCAVGIPVMKKGELGDWLGLRIDLMTEQGENAWLQHAELGQDVDIAILKLPSLPDNVEVFPINGAGQVADMAVTIGGEVFILGFPLGQTK